MKKKSEAPEALALLFKRDGVPNNMIVYGSMEQTQGGFKKKWREVYCRLKQLEPASQWENAAESCIRELKRASARKMLEKKRPKLLWDQCLELESSVRSHTVNGRFELNGQVSQTHMTGETADFSEFAEL